MDIKHVTAREACITENEDEKLEEQSLMSLQKLNPYYI